MATTTAPPRINIPFVSPEVESLLLWRDIKKSALVFGSITVTFVLFGLTKTSPLAILLRLVAGGLIACVAWQLIAGLMSRPGPPVPEVMLTGYSEEAWLTECKSVLPYVNQALSYLGTAVSGKNPLLSAKVAGAAFVASYILTIVPALTLAFLVAVLAFTLPKLYESRKDEADKVLGQANNKMREAYSKLDQSVLQKIPILTPKKAQ